MAFIFDGRAYAVKKEKELKKTISKLKLEGKIPNLASILIGDSPASRLYVGLKKKAAQRVGAELDIYFLPEKVKIEEIMLLIDTLNEDSFVKGIMIQLPLPGSLELHREEIIGAIDPNKDVDGLKKDSKFLHPTSKAVAQILDEAKNEVEVKIKKICVVGSTGMVGAPLIKELKREGYDVVGCNHSTKSLAQETLKADAVISATGITNLIKGDMVKGGAVVIDVGSPKGDVDFSEVSKTASFITPVPGGVGPMTVTCLLENLVSAC
ncbi:MAG: bifunctional 5,10-methylenetetrahydrofolate dehydrogenase/5,10-methenyltetrahydrofolate cyclohydrolase [Microgenomates group bacterium]